MEKAVRRVSAAVNLLIAAVMSVTVYYSEALPDSYLVSGGSELALNTPLAITAEELPPDTRLNVRAVISESSTARSISQLKLFGTVPIKTVAVRSVDRPVLVAGGNPFGIKMLTDGVLVVGLESIDGCCPAGDAGVRAGDILTSVNGRSVSSNADVRKALNAGRGGTAVITFTRSGYPHEVSVTPVYCGEDKQYKAGMYVRDSSAGIGTITYYDPQTGRFGGLGHPICDVDTGSLMPLSSGEVVAVSINGVARGTAGAPGELIGCFITGIPIGTLESNNSCGLFGTLDSAPNLTSPIPVAMRQEAEVGSAELLTTLHGVTPEAYRIEIEKVDLGDSSNGRNMVIRITDERLLSETGGIVQGMSGSPIIQNGRLVGAVTHVFVSNPAKGYAIFCDSMLNADASAESTAADSAA